MNYCQARNKYLQKKFENPLPPLQENERIYFQADWYDREALRYCHCGFDKDKKLWFTGYLNSKLEFLVSYYGVHGATSDKAMGLLEKQIEKNRML